MQASIRGGFEERDDGSATAGDDVLGVLPSGVGMAIDIAVKRNNTVHSCILKSAEETDINRKNTIGTDCNGP